MKPSNVFAVVFAVLAYAAPIVAYVFARSEEQRYVAKYGWACGNTMLGYLFLAVLVSGILALATSAIRFRQLSYRWRVEHRKFAVFFEVIVVFAPAVFVSLAVSGHL